jgi:catechol 2,3-dioxygenase-like lactoylglutathione lyase family enzyme
MLGSFEAQATVAVRDLDAAARFYEGTLGLTRVAEEGGQAYVYETGTARMLVYVSQYARTNQATAVSWIVGDRIDALVKALEAKGVRFERYEMPGTTHDGAIHVAGRMRVAWFKDPDGNIHSLANG